ncbi:transposase zinc-binding domain-containing protein [Nannocystis pusilla]|uniref:transposase zinc-binding domain-containing protein n=1 Tax=Nannocystis pusilla TaxID=889268 RepID=UPI003DA6473E
MLVRRHLADFLARLEESGHSPLPEFVKAELEGFAGCGDFARGFVRTAWRTCGDELRVPFACRGRGFCPSCMGRPASGSSSVTTRPSRAKRPRHTLTVSTWQPNLRAVSWFE